MFTLDAAQKSKLRTWQQEQEELVKSEGKNVDLNGEPYYGAIGGELTYSFTPTSLAIIVKVKHAVTENEIDLSDYDSF